MKTAVIQLETHDNLVSVRDKMFWAKTERILLVWPPRRKINLRPLDLVLLKRHAFGLGAQLGLVTRSVDMRRAGEEARLPVFRTSSEAQRMVWPVVADKSLKRRRRRKRRNLRAVLDSIRWKEPEWIRKPAVRIIFFALGLLAVSVLLMIFLPSATVRLHPERIDQSVAIPVVISPNTSAVTLAGALPAREITTEVSASDSIQASGHIKVPDKQASGKVRFTNLTEAITTIPAGTIVLAVDSAGIRFVTTKAGTTSAGLGKSIVLPVNAIEPGISGNLPADRLKALEGGLGLLLAVTNEEPTGGGSVTESLAPSAADRSKLFERLSDKLMLKAEGQLLAQLPAGSLLLPNTLSLIDTVDERYDPPEGLAGDAVTLDLHQTFRANYVSAEDLKLLGSQVLNASLLEGYIPVINTLSIVPQGESENYGAEIKWAMRASQLVEPALDPVAVSQYMLGKSVKGAVSSLAVLSRNSESRIDMFPSWWPWMPLLPIRINIVAD